MHGHFQGTAKAELWGCAVHPKEQIFASCGGDQTIRTWKENVMIAASEQFTHDLTAVDWSSNGAFIVVGDRNGTIHLVDPTTLANLGSIPGTNANLKEPWVEDLKISPDCTTVVFGTHAGRSKIEIVKVLENGKKL